MNSMFLWELVYWAGIFCVLSLLSYQSILTINNQFRLSPESELSLKYWIYYDI